MAGETRLDEESLTPLYQQVMEEIKRGIESGVYATGEKIPSEAELSEMYSVSRITVRRAVEELVEQGLLTKRQGKGTYVITHKLTRKVTQESMVLSFSDTCKVNGLVPGARVLDRQVVSAGAEGQHYLGVSPDDKLVYIRRVRTADGEPIMLENNYYNYDRFAFLMDANLDDVSLFDVIEDRLGFKPDDSTPSTIEIVLATTDVARDLSISVGEPLFLLESCMLGNNGEALYFEHQYIVGSRFTFVV